MKLKPIIMYRECSDLLENTFGHIISVNQAVDEKIGFLPKTWYLHSAWRCETCVIATVPGPNAMKQSDPPNNMFFIWTTMYNLDSPRASPAIGFHLKNLLTEKLSCQRQRTKHTWANVISSVFFVAWKPPSCQSNSTELNIKHAVAKITVIDWHHF